MKCVPRNIRLSYSQSMSSLARNYKTVPVLTKYEEITVISARIKQLLSGAEPLIDLDPYTNYSVHQIARLEYEKNLLDFQIERKLPYRDADTVRVNECRRPL